MTVVALKDASVRARLHPYVEAYLTYKKPRVTVSSFRGYVSTPGSVVIPSGCIQ